MCVGETVCVRGACTRACFLPFIQSTTWPVVHLLTGSITSAIEPTLHRLSVVRERGWETRQPALRLPGSATAPRPSGLPFPSSAQRPGDSCVHLLGCCCFLGLLFLLGFFSQLSQSGLGPVSGPVNAAQPSVRDSPCVSSGIQYIPLLDPI